MLDIHFAPLQGFTDELYRRTHFECAGGVATYYTPFLRLEKGSVRGKDCRDLPEADKLPAGYHLVPQVIASDEVEFRRLVEFVVGKGYREIDLNMGCPFPMQARAGRGSGLLPREAAVCRIFAEMERLQSREPSLRFSVKMRLGLESREECLQLLPHINSAPLVHVTMHPRLGIQQYKGSVDFDGFSRFLDRCTHKVIYNGDLTEISQIYGLERSFPNLAGVMLGRGLLARPSLAAEYSSGQEWTLERRLELSLKMHEIIFSSAMITFQGDSQILAHMHSFWEYQQDSVPKKIFKKMMKSGNVKSYQEVVEELKSSLM